MTARFTSESAFRAVAAPLCALAACLAIAACGSPSHASAPTGTIHFGMSQTHYVVHQPTTSFGPDDSFAYVATVHPIAPIPAHEKILETYVRVAADGTERAVFHDSFRLAHPIHTHVALSGVTIAEFYAVGFTAPGRYRVRLWHGKDKLAQGDFSLS